MKKFLILFFSLSLIGCFSSVDLYDSNLKCLNNCNKSDCLVKGPISRDLRSIDCILLYKNKPFSGRLVFSYREKNTGFLLSRYNCEYSDGKRNGMEERESWYNNKPVEEVLINWSSNRQINYETKVISKPSF